MSKEIIPVEQIAPAICVVRGQKVLLDAALAQLYGVTTGNLNNPSVATGTAFLKTSCSA